jgi:predicted dehydrogenase
MLKNSHVPHSGTSGKRNLVSRLGVTIAGAGRIGSIRASVAQAHWKSRVVGVVDVDVHRASILARAVGSEYSTDWARSVRSPKSDVVIVSTTNDSLARVAKAALVAGKHVLVEKPGATNSEELRALCEVAARNRVICKVGFNHRFHPGIVKLRELYERGKIGRLLFLRVRHGHGGRPGYELEWRANPEVAGGGELMDQGVHGLDLINWFIPGIRKVAAWMDTCFWKMKVEDNAFVMLYGPGGACASLGVSWTQWKPLFSFEVHGSEGFAEVNGLGGAYGQEVLTYGNKGDGHTNRVFFQQKDESWELEWKHFLDCIRNGREPMSSVRESLAVMKMVEAAYLSASHNSRVVPVESTSRVSK